jgi:serine/threonine protein kinase
VPGVLVEFIDGVSLNEVEHNSPLVLQYPHIGQAAVTCFERVLQLRVVHGEGRPGNIIVRHDGRVFLFDFGLAWCHLPNLLEQAGDPECCDGAEVSWVKELLDKAGLRDKTPKEPPPNDYLWFNDFVRKWWESWRKKYYANVWDEDEEFNSTQKTSDDSDLLEWTLKRDAVDEKRTKLARFCLDE